MNIEHHPCFNPKACKTHGRVHLPVAPRCNIQCNFCDRKFDCVNETRPGVSSAILKPFQAMEYLDRVMDAKKNISVVGIAGPGDPFANPDETLTTLELVRKAYPDMLLCLATNGLNLADYLDDIARLKVSHVSITVNAVDPEIGEKIYAWVRYGKKSMGPEKGAKLLLEKQTAAVTGLKEKGIIVKVNTIVLPGINDHHVVEIAKKMADLKVDLLNCMPYYPNSGSNFSFLLEPSKKAMAKIQAGAGKHIPQMMHCRRCRADAAGMLDEEPDVMLLINLKECADIQKEIKPHITTNKRPCIAVATREGILVNQHLGEAKQLTIYDMSSGKPEFMEQRTMPAPGGMDFRWHSMAEQIKDCRLLLVNGIGEAPKKILTEKGFEILVLDGLIHEILDAITNKQDLNPFLKRNPIRCTAECSGTGMGCM
ncbi:MAG: radical SAM protein [Desulfobacula sp.]|jgi:nitrogen fixation protein NifB